jgi:hypothetical protein
MRRRRGLSLVVVGLAVVACASAGAAKPTVTLITVNETFADDFLSEECGVDVTTHVEGKIKLREFEPHDGDRLRLDRQRRGDRHRGRQHRPVPRRRRRPCADHARRHTRAEHRRPGAVRLQGRAEDRPRHRRGAARADCPLRHHEGLRGADGVSGMTPALCGTTRREQRRRALGAAAAGRSPGRPRRSGAVEWRR